VAGDSVSERALDFLGHLSALAALAFAGRGATLLDGWMQVAPVHGELDLPLLSIIVPARNEARTIARCVISLRICSGSK